MEAERRRVDPSIEADGIATAACPADVAVSMGTPAELEWRRAPIDRSKLGPTIDQRAVSRRIWMARAHGRNFCCRTGPRWFGNCTPNVPDLGAESADTAERPAGGSSRCVCPGELGRGRRASWLPCSAVADREIAFGWDATEVRALADVPEYTDGDPVADALSSARVSGKAVARAGSRVVRFTAAWTAEPTLRRSVVVCCPELLPGRRHSSRFRRPQSGSQPKAPPRCLASGEPRSARCALRLRRRHGREAERRWMPRAGCEPDAPSLHWPVLAAGRGPAARASGAEVAKRRTGRADPAGHCR